MAAKSGINLILCYMKIPVPHYPIPGLQEVWVGRQGESANWKQYNSACEESKARSCFASLTFMWAKPNPDMIVLRA